jgi:hypothetical protein
LKDLAPAPEVAPITTEAPAASQNAPVTPQGAPQATQEPSPVVEAGAGDIDGLEVTPEEAEKSGKKYAGKYSSIRAFEEGYKNARQLQTRSAERANEMELRYNEAEERAKRLEEMLNKASSSASGEIQTRYNEAVERANKLEEMLGRVTTQYQAHASKLEQSREAERAAEFEQRYAEAADREAQLRDTLNRMTTQMQYQQRMNQQLAQQQFQQLQQPQQPQKQLYDEDGNPVQMQPPSPSYTPEQMNYLLNQAVSQAMYEREQQEQEQYAYNEGQQQDVHSAERAIQAFYQRHPGVYQTEQDNAVYETVQALNTAWQHTGSSLDIGDDEALEIAYEAALNPSLRQVLEANPEFIDSDAGMELARFKAGIPSPTAPSEPQQEMSPEDDMLNELKQATSEVPALTSNIAPTQPVAAPTQGQVIGQRKPVTERAGASSSAGEDVTDEFAEGVLAYRQQQKGSLSGSVFG